MGPRLRVAPLAGRVLVDRDRHRPRRARRHGRRQPARQVRAPRDGHAEGDRPDRVPVRFGAGRRAEHRVRRARGSAPRHAPTEGRDRESGRAPEDAGVQADEGQGGARERRGSVLEGHVLRQRADCIHRGAVRPGDLRQGPERGPRGRERGQRRPREHRRQGGVQRRRRVPADPAGDPGAARADDGADRAADRLPDVRRRLDPDRAGADGARLRVPAPVHPRRADRHQHDHADPRLDDRARRRYRLFALHRHPLQAALARGPRTARRSGRGCGLRGQGRPLRGLHGRHLGQRARVLRPRLRDEARDRRGARRRDDRADRQLAADRGAEAPRPQDRPVEGAGSCARSTIRRARGRRRSPPAGAGSSPLTRSRSSSSC